MTRYVEHFYNEDDECAVLVSEAYGAGWSTWNDKYLAVDAEVVKLWLKYGPVDRDRLNEIADQIAQLGYNKPSMGGWNDIVLRWVPAGTKFVINEYDGKETLKEFTFDYFCA